MSRNSPAVAGATFPSAGTHSNHTLAKRNDSVFMDKGKKGRKCGPVKTSAPNGTNPSASGATEESDSDADTEDSNADQEEDDDDDDDDEENDEIAPSDNTKKKPALKESMSRQAGLSTGANHRKRNSAHLSGEYRPETQKRSRPAEVSDEDVSSVAEKVNEAALFSDGGYSAAGQISDSDDSDTAMENAEEEIIAQEEGAHIKHANYAASSQLSDVESTDFEGFTTDVGNMIDSHHFFDEEFHQSATFDDYLTAADETPVPNRKGSDSSARHVHFADGVPGSDTSDSGSTSYLEKVFPDLINGSDLPLSVRRAIHFQYEEDLRNGIGSDSDDAYWAVEDEEDTMSDFKAPIFFADGDLTPDESGSLSGYETDIGDTTDEEELVQIPRASSQQEQVQSQSPKPANSPTPTKAPSTPPKAPPSKTPVFKTPATKTPATATPATKAPASKASVTKSSRQKGPRLGTFVPDPTKTTVMYNHVNSRLIYRASAVHCEESHLVQTSALSSLDNSPATLSLDFLPDASPMVRGMGNDFSMHSMLSPTLGNDLFGPATSQQSGGSHFIGEYEPHVLASDFDLGFAAEDDDTEPDVDMELDQFLNVNESEDDETTDATDEISSPKTATGSLLAPFSSPAPSTQTSRDDVSHLLTGGIVVGSFKNNQERHREFSSRHANRFSFTQPVRHGRNANSLITPPRRRRGSSNPHARAMSRTNVAGIVGHGSARST